MTQMENFKKLHVSNYTIITKIEKINKYLLLHGFSGAISLISERLGNILINNKIEQLNKDEIDYFKSKYFITYKTLFEEKEELKKAYNKFEKIYKKGAGFLLIFSYNCNFRCPYCYEKNLLRKGKDWLNKKMDRQNIDKAIEVMKELDKNAKSISFYGGEPLMKENYDIVEYAIEKLKENGFTHFDAITNGYDLEIYKKYLGNTFKFFQITVDGPEKIHNKRRFLEGRKPTFNKIIENINLALDKGVRISVRINMDKTNFSGIEELKEIFDKKGFLKNKNFSFYISPVDGKDKKNYFTNYELKTEIEKRYSNEKFDINFQHKQIFSTMYNALKTKSPYMFKVLSCAANSGMYIFDPFYDIYPCWDLVGKKEFVIGTYKDGLKFNDNKGYWHNRVVKNMEECLGCKYALICGGGCSARAYRRTGTIFSKDCGEIDKYFPEIANNVVIQFLNEKENEKNHKNNIYYNIKNKNDNNIIKTKNYYEKEEVKEVKK